MTETRLNVRVDDTTKKQAEAVFAALELGGDSIERRMREAVNAKVSAVKSVGSPVALYDELQNRPYLEYPDGSRVCEIE